MARYSFTAGKRLFLPFALRLIALRLFSGRRTAGGRGQDRLFRRGASQHETVARWSIAGFQRGGEAELVAGRVAHVEVALAPGRVARGALGGEPGFAHPGVGGVHGVHPEDDPAPRRAIPWTPRRSLEVQE